MRKFIANICIGVLGKLGYSNDYRRDNTQVIRIKYEVDDSELKRSIGVIEHLSRSCKEYISVKKKADGLQA